MKKIILGLLLLVLLVAAALAWSFFGPGTAFREDKYTLYIKTGMNYEQLRDSLKQNHIIQNNWLFNWLAKNRDYPANLKAGKYEIKKGSSLVDIVRMLRNGKQTPVKLVITKLRTRQDLASYVGKRFETDSAAFMDLLSNNDSLKEYGLDSNTVMAAVFPNTYSLFWNSGPERIFRKLYNTSKSYWTPEKIELASRQKLTPVTAYILASIVEEETNRAEDKPKIASVYLNRLRSNMKLAADPTVKFALHNFELKRLYTKYLQVESPYNTYRVTGLPPGPICTPSTATLDAVLNAPQTNYLYFVAKPDFSGYSNFSSNFNDHLKFAKAYQQSLDAQQKIAEEAKLQAQK